MDQILQLWLPILVSTVLVFVVSAILWMLTPIHKNDYKNPGDKEGGIQSAFASASLEPGVYFIPSAMCGKGPDAKEKAKTATGPFVSFTVLPEKPNFGYSLILWFINSLLVSALVGYVTTHTLLPDTAYLRVFQAAGAVATLAYCGYLLPLVAWHSLPLKQLPGKIFDGLVYSLLTAGSFAAFWPSAVHG